MRDLKAYWAHVREIERDLEADAQDGSVFVTQLPNADQGIDGGAVCRVTVAVGAVNLANGTHRLSSDAEVEAYKEHQNLAAQVIQAQEARHRGEDTYVVEFRK